MKTVILLITTLIIEFQLYSQIAINTTNPSQASSLHIEARKPGSNNFGGLLIPRVTESQLLLIPVTAADDAMMIFISDPITNKHCLTMYDGAAKLWRIIKCNSTKICDGMPLYSEDFSGYIDPSGINGLNAGLGSYPQDVSKWVLSSYSKVPRNGSPQYPGSLTDAESKAVVIANELRAKDINGPLLFQTQKINIEGYESISFSLEITNIGTTLEYYPDEHINDFNCGGTSNFNGSDYVDIEYSTDGGYTFKEIKNYLNNGSVDHTFIGTFLPSSVLRQLTITGLNGTSLVIRVRFQNWASTEVIKLDNLIVTCN